MQPRPCRVEWRRVPCNALIDLGQVIGERLRGALAARKQRNPVENAAYAATRTAYRLVMTRNDA